MKPAHSSPEKVDVTLAKGLGIILVVVGHILARGRSEGNDWFVVLKDCVYLFHMAFFMYLSGYVFFKPGRLQRLRAAFADFAKKQSLRLLLPFAAMGITILLLKLVLQQVVHVDNAPEGMVTGLRDLFWTTDKSPSIFVWYVFVLYVFTLLSPTLLYRLFKEDMWKWLVLGCCIYALPLIPYLYLSKATLYFLFFALGGFLRQKETVYEVLLDRFWQAFLFLFLCSFALKFLPFSWKLNHLVVSICAIPALHGLCRVLAIRRNVLHTAFKALGDSSYSIYLFNTLAIGAAKAAIFKVSDWHGGNFYWVAPALILSGLVLPLLAERLVLLRISWIRVHILGKAA